MLLGDHDFSMLNSTTMAALCLMVHLAYSDRYAISVTSSALVLEDSARGKACVWRFQSTSSPGISRDSPPFVVWNWILNTKAGYFSEENHGSIVYSTVRGSTKVIPEENIPLASLLHVISLA